jgi:Ca2+-binding EF-hand superfamily protein
MKRIFRSRLPPSLTATQISHLTSQSNLSEEDVQDWYERFNHCYPCGYLSHKEFMIYINQFYAYNGHENRLSKSITKQLFRLLDLNEDKQLNFEEFFFFHILINQGSTEEKLKLILRLYDRDEKKYLTRQELEDVLISMFDLLNMTKSKNDLSQKIDTILSRANFNSQNSKISWRTFSTHILNDSSLYELLISKDINRKNITDDFDIIVTRL